MSKHEQDHARNTKNKEKMPGQPGYVLWLMLKQVRYYLSTSDRIHESGFLDALVQ